MENDADFQLRQTAAKRNQAADEWLLTCQLLHAALRSVRLETAERRLVLTREVARLFASVVTQWELDPMLGSEVMASHTDALGTDWFIRHLGGTR